MVVNNSKIGWSIIGMLAFNISFETLSKLVYLLFVKLFIASKISFFVKGFSKLSLWRSILFIYLMSKNGLNLTKDEPVELAHSLLGQRNLLYNLE